jgi:hypothetical protein
MAGKSVAEVAVEIALEEAKQGVFETANNNRGPRIDEYQRVANNTLGQSWCAKFVYWCFEQAAKRTGVSNPLPKIWGAGQLESWAISQKKTVTTPALGDVFVKEHRHVGLVAGPAMSGGTIPSVEGNTWGGTTFEKRREGVYALKNTKVAKCVFMRLV